MGDRRVAITHCRCSVTRFTGSDVLLFVSRGCARYAGLPLPSILRPLRGLSYAARLRSPSAHQIPICCLKCAYNATIFNCRVIRVVPQLTLLHHSL